MCIIPGEFIRQGWQRPVCKQVMPYCPCKGQTEMVYASKP
jgi:hypothetical protein